MTEFSTSAAVYFPPSAAMPAAATVPLWQRIRHALMQWWHGRCLHAERKTRFVPYY